MNKASYIKRLEAVEESLGSRVNIVVWLGLPPIHVQVSTDTGGKFKSELKLFETMGDINEYLLANYFGVEPLVLSCGDIASSVFYSYGE